MPGSAVQATDEGSCPVFTRGSRCATAVAAVALLSLCGCGGLSAGEVESLGSALADAESDPVARCELLAPNTRAALLEEEASGCEEAIQQIPLGSGEVASVEVGGEEAQVRLADDTLFLTRTPDGWRVAAAGCSPQGEDQPYDCRLEAS